MSKNLTALSFEGESGLKHHQLNIDIFYGTSNKSLNINLQYYDFNSDPYFNYNENTQITLDQFREFLYEEYNHKESTECLIMCFTSLRAIAYIHYDDFRITVSTDNIDLETITKVIVIPMFTY